jgi:hypothetical protein
MKKWWKYFLWIGIAAGILIIFTLIFFVYNFWSASAQVKHKLAAIKAVGDPVRLADLVRKYIPPEQNSATYLFRAKDDMNAAVNEVSDLKSYQDWRYDPEDLKKIKDTLDAYPKIYPLLQQAAACLDFSSQLDCNLPPSKFMEAVCDQVNSGRSSARYLRARAKLLLFQGDRDGAMQSAVLMFQLSRQFEHEPLLINYLVIKAIEYNATECANEVLQAGPVSNQTRAALDDELALHGSLEHLRTALKSERAYSMDSLIGQVGGPWIFSNLWQLSILNLFEEILNYSLSPYSDWVAKIDMKPTTPNSMFSVIADQTNLMANLMTPAFRSTLIAAYRTQAQIRAIRIINALQKKNPAESNTMPTMAELDLPDEVGIDPFNGKPMIIKKLPDGWLVYSVGENLKDDGGQVEEKANDKPLDVGFGPKIPTQSEDNEPTQ